MEPATSGEIANGALVKTKIPRDDGRVVGTEVVK